MKKMKALITISSSSLRKGFIIGLDFNSVPSFPSSAQWFNFPASPPGFLDRKDNCLENRNLVLTVPKTRFPGEEVKVGA
jgi:hypothetical protein